MKPTCSPNVGHPQPSQGGDAAPAGGHPVSICTGIFPWLAFFCKQMVLLRTVTKLKVVGVVEQFGLAGWGRPKACFGLVHPPHSQLEVWLPR